MRQEWGSGQTSRASPPLPRKEARESLLIFFFLPFLSDDAPDLELPFDKVDLESARAEQEEALQNGPPLDARERRLGSCRCECTG